MKKIADKRTALYRHFSADSKLLYVGVSLNALVRLAQHRGGSDWFAQIARVDIEWFDDRPSALKAERTAIQAENPTFNRIRYGAGGVEAKPAGGALYAILDFDQAKGDGWYTREAEAEEMLAFWRSEYPSHRIELTWVPRGEHAPALRKLGDDEWLRRYAGGDFA